MIPLRFEARTVAPGCSLRECDSTRRQAEHKRHCRALCVWLKKNGIPGYEYQAPDREDAYKCYGGIVRVDLTSTLPLLDLTRYSGRIWGAASAENAPSNIAPFVGRSPADDIVRLVEHVNDPSTYRLFDLRVVSDHQALLDTIRSLAGLKTYRSRTTLGVDRG